MAMLPVGDAEFKLAKALRNNDVIKWVRLFRDAHKCGLKKWNDRQLLMSVIREQNGSIVADKTKIPVPHWASRDGQDHSFEIPLMLHPLLKIKPLETVRQR